MSRFAASFRGLCLLGFLLFTLMPILGAQEAPVSIVEVDFGEALPRRGDEEWFEVVIEVEGQVREASLRREPLRLGLELAFRNREGEFAFFRARVGLLVPEAGEDVEVRFYLPPGVLDTWEVRGEPFAWRVWMGQGERVFAQAPGTYSDSLRDPEAARSFARRLTEEAEANDGWLQPIYLTPFFESENNRLRNSASFLRPEATHGTGND